MVMVRTSYEAKEVIEKIKAYEEQKKVEEEIKVGDEIISDLGEKAVVTRINEWEVIECLNKNGQFIIYDEKEHWEKTGRHFPQIEEMLKEMENEESGEIPFM